MTLLDELRAHLITTGLVRAPDVAGPGARPWLPPAWRHPDDGAIGPGDATDQGKATTVRDDGLVVSLMIAPGIAPAPGEEDRRQDGVDVVMRGTAVPPILTLDAAIRAQLSGTNPGGRTDWVMGGLHIIQSRQWRPLAAISTSPGAFTFSVGYLFERHVA